MARLKRYDRKLLVYPIPDGKYQNHGVWYFEEFKLNREYYIMLGLIRSITDAIKLYCYSYPHRKFHNRQP